MCKEIKKIKEQYNYDFSSLLINDNSSADKINNEIESIAKKLLISILDKIEKIDNAPYATPIVGISNYFGFKNFPGDFSNLKDKNSQYRDASGMIAIDGDLINRLNTDKIIILSKKRKFWS